MLLYDYDAPSPRRVRIFLAEKGLSIPTRKIDLAKGEQLSVEYQAKNPRGTVPTLELDDGSCLWDTLAICEYMETLHPQPPLFGNTPLDHARVVMWYQRIELDGFHSVAEVMRNASRMFRDRALPGTLNLKQLPELVERGKARTLQFYRDMNAHLQASVNVAGDSFTLADIQLLCVLDFATGWGRMPIPPEREALLAWHAKTTERPSAKR
jgi:glutathione S-transferase